MLNSMWGFGRAGHATAIAASTSSGMVPAASTPSTPASALMRITGSAGPAPPLCQRSRLPCCAKRPSAPTVPSIQHRIFIARIRATLLFLAHHARRQNQTAQPCRPCPCLSSRAPRSPSKGTSECNETQTCVCCCIKKMLPL